MVNILTIALTHAIMLLAAWRIMLRDDLDIDPEPVDEPASPKPEAPVRRPRKRSRLRS